MQLKTIEPYCFGFNADQDTVFDIDYLVTGDQPENVDFIVTQGGVELHRIEKKRDATLQISSRLDAEI